MLYVRIMLLSALNVAELLIWGERFLAEFFFNKVGRPPFFLKELLPRMCFWRKFPNFLKNFFFCDTSRRQVLQLIRYLLGIDPLLTSFSPVLYSLQKPVIWFYDANQMTGFYVKCNIDLKLVNQGSFIII